MKYPPIYYGEYLELDKILNAQSLKSKEHGTEAHDETLFIITHQAYELWFKQILHELKSIHTLFSEKKMNPNAIGLIGHRLNRVIQIQRVLNEQLSIMETMSSLEFMEFRDYLVPASGFQSVQFRLIEIILGLRQKFRLNIDKEFFNSRLKDKDKKILHDAEAEPTLLEHIDTWLSRMPFGKNDEFDFWSEYQKSIKKMIQNDHDIISSNVTLSEKEKAFELKNLERTEESYQILFDKAKYDELYKTGEFRLSQDAKLAAIFIQLFRHEPIFQGPNQILVQLLDIDELFSTWRYRHAIMAHRMLGTKIGTGGSSGHEYLKRSTENNRVFKDLFDLATFLIPTEYVPKLPEELRQKLGFYFSNKD